MKLKSGDTVKVTAGKDKGHTGKVKKVFPKKQKVLVDGANKYKKHMKPQGERKPGGIVEMERPLPVGNVAIICPTCKQVTRVGWRRNQSGTKERFCKKCKAKL
ncbi:MAG: 50S ribosomal protein L24 [Candidatus Chisholmbacteria bacterium RIFCSPHIGHO2_01_FULL_49_18]|uniref:Large ribosomal subunit protein uL24 n=2 Tax=Candidatus Chisholmiibacteriota TaxID=1817900 RepID=A0A1G1VLT9_9BACT|nr:MAG: 50S ribosomal protein L24 [Candidatus Chisholmbacteria bacterium RIFCSPHIGHO2_01_FULL_49_18]OGY19382.1 MAG: 50S ribosomal protein L24 [Candidatus Chisholmbacteria bacterium RIFCSPLOWO2_01_FULL_49_14]